MFCRAPRNLRRNQVMSLVVQRKLTQQLGNKGSTFSIFLQQKKFGLLGFPSYFIRKRCFSVLMLWNTSLIYFSFSLLKSNKRKQRFDVVLSTLSNCEWRSEKGTVVRDKVKGETVTVKETKQHDCFKEVTLWKICPHLHINRQTVLSLLCCYLLQPGPGEQNSQKLGSSESTVALE